MPPSRSRPTARRRRRPLHVETLEGRVVPATITVLNTDDSGLGSLREAIEAANLDAAEDTIEFAPGVGGAITLVTALPELSTDIAIEGSGASTLTVARSAAPGTPEFRIFTVRAGAEVTISGLTIAGGRADESDGGGIANSGMLTLTNSALTGNSATSGYGGGIFNDGTLVVTSSTLSGNSTINTAPSITFSNAGGGGISNRGTLTVTASALTGNSANSLLGGFSFGGGIDNSGTLTVTASTLSGNTAYAGGGINNTGTLAVTNSTLSGNTATTGGGGGIANNVTRAVTNRGTVTVINSTLSGNTATSGGGGGIANGGSTLVVTASTLSGNLASAGGGISNRGTVTIIDSTLSGNAASVPFGGISNGGGIDNSGTLTVTASTLSGNSAASGGGIANRVNGTATVTTSLFANPAGGNLVVAAGVPFVSGGHNLFSDTPGVALDPTDLVDTDPLLGPLAANGGPTSTHALLPGSPAIDAGLAVAGLTADQRGVSRPLGFAPDIGAFEFAFPFAATVSAVTATAGVPATLTFATFTASSATASPTDFRATVDFGDGRSAPGVVARGPDGGFIVASEHVYASPGIYRSTVTLTGPGDIPAAATGLAVVNPPDVVPPPAAVAPTVVALRRFGFHPRPTSLVLTFSTALDPARALDPGNYRLGMPGRPRRTIRLRAVRYDPSAHAVTLTAARRLPLSRRFVLTVDGTPPDGLTSSVGVPLAGRDSQAGTDFVAAIDRTALVLPTSPSAGSRERPGRRSRP